ncbi:MAG: RNA polymerase sigma factor [Planctomycetota bacterium]
MNSPCTTELAAIRQCRNGSRKAFEVVVNKYMKDAYYIALGFVGNQEDAMDLSQEAFFRAYRNLDSLKSDSKFFPWFYQILKNLCFSHLRKFRNKKTLSLDGAEKPIDIQDDKNSFDPEMVAERNEAKDKLWQAIGQLDEKHREVIILRHFQNYSYDQIAKTLLYSKGTVMSRLYYARKKLRELLDDKKGGSK